MKAQRLAVAIGAVAVLLAGGIAYAAIPDGDGYTYICVSNGDGSMRAREKGATCPKNFTPSRVVATQNAVPTTTTYIESKSFPIAADASGSAATVDCAEGDVATGGGFSFASDLLEISTSSPTSDGGVDYPTGWHVSVRRDSPGAGAGYALYVVCQHTE